MIYLSLKTKDNKTFLIESKYYENLEKFIDLFDIEVNLVTTAMTKTITLEQLAAYFCSQTTNINVKNRKAISPQEIRNYLESEFMKGNVVALRSVIEKFKSACLTAGCLCNHLSQARKRLIEKGYKIEKIGGGMYKMTK